VRECVKLLQYSKKKWEEKAMASYLASYKRAGMNMACSCTTDLINSQLHDYTVALANY
jgi:hypothetical protein